jgi:2-polyprenyl-6-methoxyphenol hydroxylase-like FAD-dependent oxidoreductase
MNRSNDILKTQVIIAGAGPTGLSMAAQLLRYNIDFLLLEKNAGTTIYSKAIVVQARTMEIFRELGLADKAIHEGKITTAINLFYKGKRRAAVNLSGLGEGLSAFPFALSLEQSKTEKLLAEFLFENGKEILWNSSLIHFEQDNDSITVSISTKNGEEQKIQAAYLVGCDGASSLVRHQLNLSFKGTTEPKLFYVADVILRSPVINRNELFMYMIKKGFVLFFPMEGEGHYRLVGILPNAKDKEVDYKFEDIEQSIKQKIVSPVKFEKLQWFSTYKVHSRKAEAFMTGRCFLAGDAAHIHTPAGGQGMNTGIQDAYNLAWKIAYSLKNEVNIDVLKTYNTERKGNAKHLLRTTDRMFDLMSGVNPFWNFLRSNFFPKLLGLIAKNELVKKQIFPLISQTGITYPDSYLTLKSSVGKVKAGGRMPYFVFSNKKDIFIYIKEPVFKLIFFGNENKNRNSEFSYIKPQTKTFIFTEIPKIVFGTETNFYILLRPDNHISYIGKDINKCKEFMDKITSHWANNRK